MLLHDEDMLACSVRILRSQLYAGPGYPEAWKAESLARARVCRTLAEELSCTEPERDLYRQGRAAVGGGRRWLTR